MTNVPFLNSVTNVLSKNDVKGVELADALMDITKGNEKLDDLLTLQASASEIDRVAFYNNDAINALAQAKNRRVDLVMLGDSNQVKDGKGFHYAFAERLGERFGMYASGIGASASMSNESARPVAGGSGTLPAGIEAIFPKKSPAIAYYFESGTFTPSSGGTYINSGSKLDITKALDFHYVWGSFDTGSGSFKAGVRLNGSPYTVLGSSAVTSTNTGSFAKNITKVSIPADATRTLGLEARWFNTTAITAPFSQFYERAENPANVSGISVHSLHAVGGDSLCDFAIKMLGYSDLALKNFFEETRRLQISKKQKPIVVVYINSGVNDRNETIVSQGWRADTDADSPEAYQDNLEVIINRLKSVYSMNWDADELYFLICPSHPISNPDDSELLEYRKKARETVFREDRSSYVNISSLVTYEYMLANGYYLSGGTDTFHLNTDGYLDIVGKIVDLIPDID